MFKWHVSACSAPGKHCCFVADHLASGPISRAPSLGEIRSGVAPIHRVKQLPARCGLGAASRFPSRINAATPSREATTADAVCGDSTVPVFTDGLIQISLFSGHIGGFSVAGSCFGS